MTNNHPRQPYTHKHYAKKKNINIAEDNYHVNMNTDRAALSSTCLKSRQIRKALGGLFILGILDPCRAFTVLNHHSISSSSTTDLHISQSSNNMNSSSSNSNSYQNGKQILKTITSAMEEEDEFEVEQAELEARKKAIRSTLVPTKMTMEIPEQARIVSKQEQVAQRQQEQMDTVYPSVTFDITLPIVNTGLVARQLNRNSAGDGEYARLSLDSLQYSSGSSVKVVNVDDDSSTNDQQAETVVLQLIDAGLTNAVVLDEVVEGSVADKLGLKVGDVIVGTSATMGEQVWAKSTLDGVRSAISSRKLMNSELTLRIRRYANLCDASLMSEQEVTECFDLTLMKPLGIQVADSFTEDQSPVVVVTGVAANATAVVREKVQIGDKITAIDNAFSSTTLSAVSTVEGLISSVTSRLPSQPVKLRFERTVQVGSFDAVSDLTNNGEVSSKINPTSSIATTASNGIAVRETSNVDTTQAQRGSNIQNLLLNRCRRVLTKYLTQYSPLLSKSIDSTSTPLPIQAADKVLLALSQAKAVVDAKTLNLIMTSYLVCGDAKGALVAFETCTGLNANGIEYIPQSVHEFSGIQVDRDALDLAVGTALLKAHALNGDFKSAGRVLMALEGKSGQFSPFVDSIPAADWMPENGIAVGSDIVSYNIVLDAACRSKNENRIEEALTFFDKIPNEVSEEGKISKDTVTYNTLINAFAEAKKKNDAYSVFYSMQQNGRSPDKITYTSLIKAIIVSETSSESAIEAMDVLRDMFSQGIDADIVTYNTVIQALCDNGNLFEAKQLASEMELCKIQPNSVTYGLLMNGMMKTNKPGPCLTLFESACLDRRTSSVAQNVELYTTAITAAAKLSDYGRALELFDRMNLANLSPNIKTISSLIQVCLRTGHAQAAVEFVESAKANMKMDRFAYVLAIRAYSMDGRIEEARKCLSEACSPEKRLFRGKDTMQAYDSMLEASLRGKQYEVAKEILNEMLLEKNFIPSKWTFNSILTGLEMNSFIKRGQKEKNDESFNSAKFEFMLFMMDILAKRNLPIDGATYCAILNECARANGAERRLGSLIPKSKEYTDSTAMSKNNMVKKNLTWQELLKKNIDFRKTNPNDIALPPLRVRISSKAKGKTLKNISRGMIDSAERAVYIKPRRMNQKQKKERKALLAAQ